MGLLFGVGLGGVVFVVVGVDDGGGFVVVCGVVLFWFGFVFGGCGCVGGVLLWAVLDFVCCWVGGLLCWWIWCGRGVRCGSW
ncbi:hypothetical protein RA279_28105, partial [Pseudomonas syringae pv. tagetis]|uniref:hypothetical protein n=1 Tax=Pseudomonas syringae group genomosp. 7 TaxID=251699 RepID=UPI0037704941